MYIKRHAEATIQQLSKMFGAILVTGPRQVGKTTMLQAITKDMGYVTLDDPIIRVVFHIIYNFMLHIIYHRFRNCHSGFSTLFNPNYAY